MWKNQPFLSFLLRLCHPTDILRLLSPTFAARCLPACLPARPPAAGVFFPGDTAVAAAAAAAAQCCVLPLLSLTFQASRLVSLVKAPGSEGAGGPGRGQRGDGFFPSVCQVNYRSQPLLLPLPLDRRVALSRYAIICKYTHTKTDRPSPSNV